MSLSDRSIRTGLSQASVGATIQKGIINFILLATCTLPGFESNFIYLKGYLYFRYLISPIQLALKEKVSKHPN
jgi:hypothetical protein